MSQQKPRKDNKDLRNAARLTGIAIQMGATIYLGNFLGSWLDGKFDKTFWETTCTLLAIVLSIYSVIKQANRLNS
ncbi:AtpZ/AtpI family protein [Maribacter antarcticus]|uniref:AtpZ/AtpI family protein n=1 Tax=Maribacter antarcticus TaxID=505250 RepID=UPI00047BFA28|nr:AtpZ/AtpI family protein [Maribacter antarcticus]